jgi:hypothetical protein
LNNHYKNQQMAGGKREGAGRKSKAIEQQANQIILNALKVMYSTDCEEQAKQDFIIELASNIRGKMFIAEHLLGKPKENLNLTTNKHKTMQLTDQDLREIQISFKD